MRNITKKATTIHAKTANKTLKPSDKKSCIRSGSTKRVRASKLTPVIDYHTAWELANQADLLAFQQGHCNRIYNVLGSHPATEEGKSGYHFAVWAPNAKSVSVVGDFNQWDSKKNPMYLHNLFGVWEAFVPGATVGQKYKYAVIGCNQQLQLKADPYGNWGEHTDSHASILCPALNGYVWNDNTWLQKRAKHNCQEQPLSIYELHIDSWRHNAKDNPLTYRELAQQLAQYLKATEFTHVELMPIMEHPFTDSWGYQITGFYAPTSRYGTPEDFQYLIDTLHQANIGVILDWVPGHFPTDDFGLARFDGTALYEHADPRQGIHPDWGTYIFNYGRNEVRNFLISNALFWIEQFHIDGLRLDAVASMLYLDYSRKPDAWIPNQYGGKENIDAINFLRELNNIIHSSYPGVLSIAEESSSFGRVSQPTQSYGLGFDFKWNMGWMHDVSNYCKLDPIFRKYHHNKMTFAMLYQRSEHFINVFSHDEVVYGKGSMVQKMGSPYLSDKLSTLRALYTFMWGWPGKKTLFMGNEFAQLDEWDFHKALSWELLEKPEHQGMLRLIFDLNHLYRTLRFWHEGDMYEGSFSWINPEDCDNSVFSFIRKSASSTHTLLFISNFTPIEHSNYECGVPFAGTWHELLNSDSTSYGGLNRGNLGSVTAIKQERDLQPCTLSLYLPPLSTIVLEFKRTHTKACDKSA